MLWTLVRTSLLLFISCFRVLSAERLLFCPSPPDVSLYVFHDGSELWAGRVLLYLPTRTISSLLFLPGKRGSMAYVAELL